jgi:hypothetical protein
LMLSGKAVYQYGISHKHDDSKFRCWPRAVIHSDGICV